MLTEKNFKVNNIMPTLFEASSLNDIVPSLFLSEDYKIGQKLDRSTHNQYLLFIVTSGEISVKISSNNYRLSKKDCVLIFPNENFSISSLKSSAHAITLGFHGDKAAEIIEKTNFSHSSPRFSFSNEAFDSFFYSSITEIKPFFTLAVLYFVMANNNNYNNNYNYNSNNNNSKLAKTIKEYINDNIDKNLKISEIAKHFNISRVYLYKIFVDSLKVTPKEYIVNKKMRKAYKLIKENKTPIYAIADSLGYKDQFVFSKAFKKTYNLSPREVSSGKIPYIVVLDEENGECLWPAQITSARAYKSNKSLLATPYYNENNNIIEGWLLRAGYFYTPTLPRSLNISTLTDFGKKGALSFSIFIERQTDITNWCIDDSDWIRFGSSTDWDTDFQYWLGWHKQIVKEGWNQIVLPFGQSKWGNVCGEPDYTDFNSFAIRLSIPKHCRCFIDNIKVIRDF